MKTYRLARPFVWFLRFAAAFFTVILVGGAVASMQGRQDHTGVVVLVGWVVYVGAIVFFGMRSVPHHVTISDTGAVTFSMIGRSVEISAADIESIRPARFDVSRQMVLLRYEGGRVRLPTMFEGFHDMLNRFQELNPNIDLDKL